MIYFININNFSDSMIYFINNLIITPSKRFMNDCLSANFVKNEQSILIIYHAIILSYVGDMNKNITGAICLIRGDKLAILLSMIFGTEYFQISIKN